MSDSPRSDDSADEPVGVILARWRKRRKLTGQALADRVGMNQSKISRLETGSVTAEPADIRLLAEVLGVSAAETERVVELAERADNRLTDWTSSVPGLADRQRDVLKMEQSAKEHRIFQPTVVPGLMQTSEYARSLLTQIKVELDDVRIADSPVAVSEAVNARMQRNEILLRHDTEFHFLITEQVLRNVVCEPSEMIGQIGRIRVVAAFPNVQMRIVTDGTPLPIAPYLGFYLADNRRLLVDLYDTSLKSHGLKIVRTYRRVFDALERVGTTDIDGILDRYQAQYAQMLLPNSVAS